MNEILNISELVKMFTKEQLPLRDIFGEGLCPSKMLYGVQTTEDESKLVATFDLKGNLLMQYVWDTDLYVYMSKMDICFKGVDTNDRASEFITPTTNLASAAAYVILLDILEDGVHLPEEPKLLKNILEFSNNGGSMVDVYNAKYKMLTEYDGVNSIELILYFLERFKYSPSATTILAMWTSFGTGINAYNKVAEAAANINAEAKDYYNSFILLAALTGRKGN